MIYNIKAPNVLNTSILLPSSKSISNRVLILNALCTNPEKIYNLSVCDDTEVVINTLHEKKSNINIGAAGTAMRFLTAYLSSQKGSFFITGTERMKNRPIKILVEALRSAGACIKYTEKEGYPPLQIEGQSLIGGDISLNGEVSSQYISALLMIAPLMTNGLRLHISGEIISRPYINITIQLMRRFGVVVFEDERSFTIPPQQYSAVKDFTVESDWSAASYWYEIIALCKNDNSTVSLQGLLPDSLQGDASIVKLFDKLGVRTTFSSSGITLSKKPPEVDRVLTLDFVSIPDMAQTIAVTCIMLNIPFRFTGLQSLVIKETDRLNALKIELRKLGYLLEINNGNSLVWNGERCKEDTSPVIETYKDHRMALCFAPVSLCREGGICIANPEVVSKSYPSYWDNLKKADFVIEKSENND